MKKNKNKNKKDPGKVIVGEYEPEAPTKHGKVVAGEYSVVPKANPNIIIS